MIEMPPVFPLLPHELALHIFSYLPYKDLTDVARVSRAWHLLALSDDLWRPLTLSQLQLRPVIREEGTPWYDFFKRMHAILHSINSDRGRQTIFPTFLEELSFLSLSDDTVCYRDGNERNLWAWNVEGGTPYLVARLPDEPCLLEVYDRLLYCVSVQQGLQVVDPTTNNIVHQCRLERLQCIPGTGYIKIVNEWLFLSFEDGTFAAWDTRTGKLRAEYRGVTSLVTHLICTEDLVVASSKSHTVRIWSRHDGELLFELRGHSAPLNRIHHYNEHLVTAGQDKRLCIWTNDGDDTIAAIEYKTSTPFFETEESLIITPSFQDPCQLMTYDLNTQTVKHCGPRFAAPISCLAKQGQDLYVGLQNGLLLCLDMQDGYRQKVLFREHMGAIKMLFILPDGLLASYGADQSAVLWNAATGKNLMTFPLKNFGLRTLLFSPGRILFVSDMNIFGAYNFTPTPMQAATSSPRIAAYLPRIRLMRPSCNILRSSL